MCFYYLYYGTPYIITYASINLLPPSLNMCHSGTVFVRETWFSSDTY